MPNAHRRCDRSWDEEKNWIVFPKNLLLLTITRHAGYKVGQVIRKRIEEAFGWAKATAGFRKTRHRGLDRVGWQFTLTMTAYNLIRLPKLLATA